MDPETPLQPFTHSKPRRGKVARLAKVTRDKICSLIQDGVPYLEILSRLGSECEGITEDHLSTWRQGGYHDWLRGQQKIDLLSGKRDLAYDLLQSKSGSQIPQAILQVLATNICEFLVDLDPETLRDSLLSDSDKFTRFVHSMVKLAEGEIKCEEHQNRQEDRTAAAAKQKPSGERPGISEESLRIAEEKLKLL